MAYTTSGQIPVGDKYTLGNYTFSLTTQDIPVTDFKYVYSEMVEESGKRDGKGVNLQLNRPIVSWYVEATETEASVYARCSNDTVPHHISVVKLPDKVVYNTGDAIDLTGIEVRAFNSDGTAWENENYPGGYIPIDELLSQFRTEQKNGFALADSVLWREEEYIFDSGPGTIGDKAYTTKSYIPYVEGGEASIFFRHNDHRNNIDRNLTANMQFVAGVGCKIVFLKYTGHDSYGNACVVVRPFAFYQSKAANYSSIAHIDTWGYEGIYNYGLTHMEYYGPWGEGSDEYYIPYYYNHKNISVYWKQYRDISNSPRYGWAYRVLDGTLFSGTLIFLREYSAGSRTYSLSQNSMPYFDIDDILNYTGSDGKTPSLDNVIDRIAMALFYTDDNELRGNNYTAITIAWKRPIDGAVLTTSFGIVNGDD